MLIVLNESQMSVVRQEKYSGSNLQSIMAHAEACKIVLLADSVKQSMLRHVKSTKRIRKTLYTVERRSVVLLSTQWKFNKVNTARSFLREGSFSPHTILHILLPLYNLYIAIYLASYFRSTYSSNIKCSPQVCGTHQSSYFRAEWTFPLYWILGAYMESVVILLSLWKDPDNSRSVDFLLK